MNSILIRTLSVVASLIFALPGTALGKEESKIKVFFENTGAEADASGKMRFKLGETEATLELKLEGLAEATEYRLLASGVEQASFTTDDGGQAKLGFVTPHSDGDERRPLEFDPRTKEITVERDDTVVLRADLLGSTAEKFRIKDRTELEPEPDAEGSAEARFDVKPNGRRELGIKLRGAIEGEYTVVVSDSPENEGVERGVFEANSGGSGKISFLFKQGNKPVKEKGKGHARRKALDFDPFTAFLELFSVDGEEDADELVYSGFMLAQLPGLTVCDPVDVTLGPVGLSGGGSLEAIFTIASDCERELFISLESVAEREHDVFIGDAGPIPIPISSGDGDVTLSTEPEGGDLPLDFDPRGDPVEVFDGDTQLFDGTFPAS